MSTAAIPLSNDDEAVIQRPVEAKSLKTPNDSVDEVYEIQRTVDEIVSCGYKRIALQFPDDLLADAATVTTRLKTALPQDVAFYVLGDTSYGSCCVDEVAAEHVNADALVHYGRSCLSPTSRLPVIYIFGRLPLDVDDFAKHIEGIVTKDTSLLVVSDTTYMSSQKAILDKLHSESFTNVTGSSLNLSPSSTESDFTTSQKYYTLSGRFYSLPKDVELSDVTMIYIGPPSPTLTTTLMTHTALVFAILSYNPLNSVLQHETTQNTALRRRYATVQKARDAGVIGIVVGTLGVSRYLDLIKHLRAMISKFGKKSYLFAMGKLNPSKMANFSEIDAFVLVACGENSMVDSKEFYKPIVTPFELSLALKTRPHDAIPWDGQWITNFEKVMSLTAERPETFDSDFDSDHDEEAPHFSLVTGKYSSSSKPMYAGLETASNNDYALTTRSTDTSLSKVGGMFSPAAQHLKTRQYWGGLGTDHNNTEDAETQDSTLLTEGRTGIARGYDDFRPE